MGLLLIFLILPLGIAIAAGYFVSLLIYNQLVKAGNKHPRTFRAISFIVSFALVLVAIFWLILANIRLER
jgi:uncharacterized membrane protein YidH (DUF202 family)